MSDNIFTKIFKPSARGRVWQIFIAIIVVTIFAGVVDSGDYYNKFADAVESKTSIHLPHYNRVIPYKLGLDLQGGTHLVYRADVSNIETSDRKNTVEGVRDVIERRVNVFGVSEPLVQTSFSGGDYRVIVELAGIQDVNQAINMIGETPLLEFKELNKEVRKLTPEEKEQLDKINKEAENKANEALDKLYLGEDFGDVAKEYSDDASKDNGGDLGYVSEKDAPNEVSVVKSLKVGEYTENFIDTNNSLDIYKLDDKRIKSNPFNEDEKEVEVKASHLLICYEGIDGCENGLSKEDAYTKIKEIKKIATPSNFADLVKENTTEPGGADRAGDLGWFSKGMMVKPFEDTVFSQDTGTISWVVETQFGYHLIYKQEERQTYEYKISKISIDKTTQEELIGPQQTWKNTELSGKNLKRASVSFNPNDNTPQVSLEFDSEGADLFADITGRNVGSQMAILLDGKSIVDTNGDGVISEGEVYAPTINEKITGGRAVISGSKNIEEAKILVRRLNAGALPVPITIINQQTVGPTLGHESLSASLEAGLIGLLLVAIFMIIYYRVPGLLAVLSLIVYGILVLFAFKFFSVTLTLAGLAGFILSIGMAVDANVLVFERLKEELKRGNPYSLSIDEAFRRAWPSIRDGNVSTLITAFILIQFSTSVVKGFAITLSLGIIISMFSAIIVTKNLLMLLGGGWLEKRKWLLGVKKST